MADPSVGAADVQAFLAALPDEQRDALASLRATIRSVVPTATEGISYGIPTFKLNGRPLVAFGAVKGHCAFYLMSTAVMDAHRDELAAYDLGKGTIRFQPDAPIPAALVRTLVEARIGENGRSAER
ncbi:MAG: iron chaperone [Actinomycetota bacterium]